MRRVAAVAVICAVCLPGWVSAQDTVPARPGGVVFTAGGAGALMAREYLSLTVVAGYGGRYRPGHWTPVDVIVDVKMPPDIAEYSGDNIRGTLRITMDTSSRSRETHEVEIEVPVLGQRRFSFLVLPEGDNIRVEFEPDRQGRIVGRLVGSGVARIIGVVRMRSIPAGARVIGTLGANDGPLRRLQGTATGGDVAVASLGKVDLPSTAPGWFGLDAMVLSLSELAGLAPQIQDGLLLWVRSGGAVILTYAGPYAKLPRAWEAALPARLTLGRQVVADAVLDGLGDTPFPHDQRVFVAVDQLEPRDLVLLRVGGVPLVTRQRVDSGSVTLLGTSVAASPFLGWSGLPGIWRLALPANAEPDTGHGVIVRVMTDAFLGFRDLSPGGLSSILVLFAVYAGIVGVGLSGVMRRTGTIQWYWVAVGSLVGGLAVVVTFSDVLSSASLGRPSIRTVTVLRARSGAEVGRAETYAAGTAHVKAHVPIEVAVSGGGVRTFPAARRLTAVEEHYRIVHEQHPVVEEALVGPTEATLLIASDVAVRVPDVSFVRVGAGRYRIKNHTGSPLLHAGVALPEGYLSLQTIGNGQVVQVDVENGPRFRTWRQQAQEKTIAYLLPGLFTVAAPTDIAGALAQRLTGQEGVRFLGAHAEEATLLAWYPVAGIAAGDARLAPAFRGHTLIALRAEEP